MGKLLIVELINIPQSKHALIRMYDVTVAVDLLILATKKDQYTFIGLPRTSILIMLTNIDCI